MNSDRRFSRRRSDFEKAAAKSGAVTVIEMLIVFGIMAMLAALLVPGITSARKLARIGQCQSNLRQIGMAMFSYCQHYNGCIPAVTDFPTNKVWNNAAGAPDSLGVLVTQSYLAEPRTLFCALDTCNSAQVDGGADRHAGRQGRRRRVLLVPLSPGMHRDGPFHVDSLGQNPEGKIMRALALDVSCPPYPEPAHSGESVNILFHDGSVKTVDNKEDLYSIMSISYYPPNAEGLPPIVAEIQKVFVNADAAYGR